MATAEPPEEYDLPIIEPAKKFRECKYHRNSFGEVTVYFSVVNEAGLANDQVIGVLPEGFRPKGHMDCPAIAQSTTELFTTGSALIYPNGEIHIILTAPNVTIFHSPSTVFIAAPGK